MCNSVTGKREFMKKSASLPLLTLRRQYRGRSETDARGYGAKTEKMQFFINYQDGYVVTWQHMNADGYERQYPIRKFLHQGDAMLFRECDAPRLSEIQLRALVKNYNPLTLYRRISNRKFEKV